jgi:hypothetical protein
VYFYLVTKSPLFAVSVIDGDNVIAKMDLHDVHRCHKNQEWQLATDFTVLCSLAEILSPHPWADKVVIKNNTPKSNSKCSPSLFCFSISFLRELVNLFISAIAIRLVCAGKFVGDSKCEKLPIEICGAGCTFEVRDHLHKNFHCYI